MFTNTMMYVHVGGNCSVLYQYLMLLYTKVGSKCGGSNYL